MRDYVASATQTADAYAEAFGKPCPEYGHTDAYAWERLRHERGCPTCEQAIPVGGFAIKADGIGQSHLKYHHVRCFDWLSMNRLSQPAAPPARARGGSLAKQLAKALDVPSFHLNLDALQGRIELDIRNPFLNDKNAVGSPGHIQHKMGVSKGFAEALWGVAKARLDAAWSPADDVADAVLEVDDLLKQLASLEEGAA